MKTVIDPQVAGAMLEHMNGNSIIAMFNQILTDSEANDVAIDQALRNDITAWQNTINTRLAETDVNIARAEALAKLLEGDELTQIESILRDLIDSDAMQALFENMSVSVGGTSYKVTSLLESLASAAKEVSGELTYDATHENITGYNMTLDDGIVINFAATVTDDEVAGTTEVVFAAADFKGVPALFGQKYYRRTTNVVSFGTPREMVTRQLKEITHVVLDLTAEIYTAPADPVPDVDGDGDNDGLVNPLAQ